MATSATSGVYVHVIEDVISKVRDEFILDGGPGEAVLNELQGLWELKMMHAGTICGPIERASASRTIPDVQATAVGDLNVPYEGTEEYETPTAEMLFPPTPLQTPIQTPLPGATDNSYNIHTGTSDYTTANDHNLNEIKPGRPSLYMQPPSPWMTQRPPLGVDVNVAYVENREELDRGTSHQPMTQDFLMMSSGKRKREDFPSQYRHGGYIPQQDGTGDHPVKFAERGIQDTKIAKIRMEISDIRSSSSTRRGGNTSSKEGIMIIIPQVDGPSTDPYDDMLSTPNIYNFHQQGGGNDNGYNLPTPNEMVQTTPQIVSVVKKNSDDDDEEEEDDDDGEPSLNEDDDDDLDDVGDADELNTQHLVLAQFDKVTRTKSRWKCTLKDGIMHINNKDILFNKATGEFEF